MLDMILFLGNRWLTEKAKKCIKNIGWARLNAKQWKRQSFQKPIGNDDPELQTLFLGVRGGEILSGKVSKRSPFQTPPWGCVEGYEVAMSPLQYDKEETSIIHYFSDSYHTEVAINRWFLNCVLEIDIILREYYLAPILFFIYMPCLLFWKKKRWGLFDIEGGWRFLELSGMA